MFKVLIVDDEELVCELIQKTIDWKKIGAQCVGAASNGIMAFEMFTELEPDLIIADIRMPGMDGISLIKAVRQTGSKCGFIIISGYQDFDYVKSAIELGADNYILKPIDQAELEATIINSIKKFSAIENNTKKITELEQEVSEVKNKNRKNFLRKIASEAEPAFGSLEELNAEYGCNYRAGMLCAGIVDIDYSDDIDKKIINKSIASLEEQLDRYVKKYLSGIIFELDTLIISNKIAFVINYDGQKEDELLKLLADMIIKTRSEQHTILFDITISLGDPVSSLSGIKTSFLQAEEASDYRIKVGVDRVIRYGNYSFAQYNVYKLLSIEWEHQFNCNIDIGNIDAIVEGIKKLFSVLYEMENVNPKAYYDLSEAILESFKNKIRFLYLGVVDETALAELTVDNTIRGHRKETIVDNLLRIIKEVLISCTEKKNLKDKKPVNFAKQYVAAHYSEKILISDITSQIFLNDDYFSIMFKKETGINFSDYVINYRMAVARQLLRSGDYTIAEVGEQVGYDDSKYFSRMFKKNIGVTPGEYKKLYD